MYLYPTLLFISQCECFGPLTVTITESNLEVFLVPIRPGCRLTLTLTVPRKPIKTWSFLEIPGRTAQLEQNVALSIDNVHNMNFLVMYSPNTVEEISPHRMSTRIVVLTLQLRLTIGRLSFRKFGKYGDFVWSIISKRFAILPTVYIVIGWISIKCEVIQSVVLSLAWACSLNQSLYSATQADQS